MEVNIFGADVEIDDSFVAESRDEIRTQVAEYERGDRREFELTVSIPETRTGVVMDAMASIPYGETRTYGEIASLVGLAPIVVGQECGRNPVPLVVPCHRVVATDSIGGFSAGGPHGIRLKRALIDLESDGPTQTDISSFG